MADSQNAVVDQILQFDDFFNEQEKLGNILTKSSLASEKFRKKGNKLYSKKDHSQDDHKKILLLYTKTISFAPNVSEELAKGYGNRSALLMHLHRYKECLVDIERALQITKSHELRIKLESRKQDCLNLHRNKPITRIFPEDLPPMQASTQILSASEAVAIKYNDTFGRHVVATRDMNPREIIIVEKGYVCFPKKYQIYIICSHCMGFAWNGIPCDTCAFAIFCSEACKQAAWQEYHDIECSIIPFVFFDKRAQITNIMVAIRLFIKAVKSEGFDIIMNEAEIASKKKIDNIESMLWNGMLVSNIFRSCYNLVNNAQDSYRKGLDNNFYETMIVNLLLRHTSIIPIDVNSNRSKMLHKLLKQLVDVFINLRNVLDVNSFVYQGNFCACTDTKKCRDLCDSARGSIIVPTCSLVNHSCCSNVSRIFIPQRKVVMYTIAPVKKGEQFCDSYGPSITMEKKERQKYLEDNFYFTCKCRACEGNWPSKISVELYRNLVADTDLIRKVAQEFQKYFPDNKDFSIKTVSKLIDERQFDKPTFEKVIRFSTLVYKYFSHREAYYRSLGFSLYIDRSFFQFYGENVSLPKDCLF